MILRAIIPGPPVAQGRPRATVVRGKPRLRDPDKSAAWKAEAIAAIQRELPAPGELLFPEGALSVTYLAVFPRPKSAPKTKRLGRQPYTASKNDIDNLLKAALDACTNAGVWRDDGQVTHVDAKRLVAAKGEAPFVHLVVSLLDDA